MAGDWIKFETTTPDKPEIDVIAQALGIDPDAVVGKLCRIWIWADQHSITGNAVTVTDAFLDRITFQPGFASAMRSAKWLVGESGLLTLPRFDRHNGQTAKLRAETNRRVSKHRAGAAESNANAVTPVTQTPLQKPLPEKRREDIKQKPSSSAAQKTGKGDPDATARKQQRLIEITDDAVAAFNSILAKPKGLLPAVHPTVGKEKRRNQVARCLRVARDICKDLTDDTTITRRFWDGYFTDCRNDEFKSGRQQPGKGHENWKPTFEYLTREAVVLEMFDKVNSED